MSTFKEKLEKAQMENAAKGPQGLPPEISNGVAQGIMLTASKKQFSNIQVGLGTPDKPVVVRIFIFRDEVLEASMTEVAKHQNKPVETKSGLIVPGRAIHE